MRCEKWDIFRGQMLRAREEWENLRGKSPESSFRNWGLAVLKNVRPDADSRLTEWPKRDFECQELLTVRIICGCFNAGDRERQRVHIAGRLDARSRSVCGAEGVQAVHSTSLNHRETRCSATGREDCPLL
jgi:hypothetical protein